MHAKNDITYSENFLFRKRKHILLDQGIRTQQSDFFRSSDIVTQIENLGYFLQYRSDLPLFDIFGAAIMLIIGVKGLSTGMDDNVVFAICVILVVSAVYWLVRMFLNLEHVGSFYFSSSTQKDKFAFEIKSRYPASPALEVFLQEIRNRQKAIAKEKLMLRISAEVYLLFFESEASYLKSVFSMEASEFKEFLNQISARYQAVLDAGKGA